MGGVVPPNPSVLPRVVLGRVVETACHVCWGYVPTINLLIYFDLFDFLPIGLSAYFSLLAHFGILAYISLSVYLGLLVYYSLL